MTTSRAVVLVDDAKIEIRELPVPDVVDPAGALLRIEACGMCGSDHDFYSGMARQTGYGEYPMVLGHEPVGRIEAIGPTAARLWGVGVGDRVAIEPYVPCGCCPACLEGNSRRCRNRFSYSSVPLTVGAGLWGGYADYMELRPNTVVHRVPEHLSSQDAVLFNPVGAALEWTLRVGQVGPGDVVVILGAGQRGLACVAAASLVGAGQIVVTSRRDGPELEIASMLGATDTVMVGGDDDGGFGRLRNVTNGQADVVIDLVPRDPRTVSLAVDLVRAGGHVVLAGLKGPERAHVDIDSVILKDISVRGVLGVSSWAYGEAVRLLGTGRFPFHHLHTGTFGLEGVEAAIQSLHGGVPRPIHMTIEP